MRWIFTKTNYGRTFQSTKFTVIHFFLTERRNLLRYCGKSFSCGFSCSDARNVTTKATEHVTFGFSSRVLVFFPLCEVLNVTVSKRYEFGNFFRCQNPRKFRQTTLDWEWWRICCTFINLIKWYERRVTCQQLIGDVKHVKKIRILFTRVITAFVRVWNPYTTPRAIW